MHFKIDIINFRDSFKQYILILRGVFRKSIIQITFITLSCKDLFMKVL